MALGKQLCCFGVVFAVLWLEANAFSKQWSFSSGTSSSSLIKPSKPHKLPVKAPQALDRVSYMPDQMPVQGPAFTRPTQRQEPKDFTADVCRVADYDKVPCGVTGTTDAECQALDCCYDGVQCYYGLTVTLHCTRDAQFIIVVSKDVTLPRLDLETVSLLGKTDDPACHPVDSNSGFAIYQFPATTCGTLLKEEGGSVIYENQMISSYEMSVGNRGYITRDSSFKVSVNCHYSGTLVEALVFEPVSLPGPVDQDEQGPFRVELRLGSGKCPTKGCPEETVAYSSYYAAGDYPISFVLREPVYVEVRLLERTDPNIVLTLGNCWSTFYPESTSMPQWDLLVDGCPYMNDLYQTTLVPVSDVDFPTHYRRFMLRMFMFVEIQKTSSPEDLVYIHCQASVCKPSPGDSCEPRCNRFQRDVSGLKQEAQETVIISSGALRFKA